MFYLLEKIGIIKRLLYYLIQIKTFITKKINSIKNIIINKKNDQTEIRTRDPHRVKVLS